MPKNNRLNTIIKSLGYNNGIVKKSIGNKIKTHPIKTNFAKQTFEILDDIDAIYFTGEYPLIYFKTLSDLNPQKIKLLQKNIWNQSRIPLMFIITPTEIRIYDCYKEPLLEQDNNIDKLEVDRFKFAVNELNKMTNIYHQSMVDSGRYWETTSGRKINATKKVDQLLISNLKEARKQLKNNLDNLEADTSLPIIHNLLSRSLFILYLEDRKVITANYYSTYSPNTTSYFEILADTKACYRLFKDLNNRFHGNLFIVSDEEKENIKVQHLQIVKQCFYGDSLRKLQFSMWRMFDFSYIPIELISSIYEEFLHTETNQDVISKDGAFYTPQCLAQFVLNEALPFPDEKNNNYNLKILDPACGSGIFLVESYRRLIERWRYTNKKQRISANVLKSILLNSIFGVEKNPEAIKVASLSLYLTMLNYLEPKYIWTKVNFPHLIKNDRPKCGENLFNGDTFVIDDYKKNKYDLIVGNPPWKVKNVDVNAKKYIEQNKLPAQIVVAFLHLLPKTFPDTKIALVSASKILFNNSKGYGEFKKFLFDEAYVDTIVNFAALRKVKGSIGRNLFSSAVGPSCVIFYQYNKPKKIKDFITYCTPKPDRKNNAISELIIDSSDIKYIPRHLALNSKINIWKIAMYGTTRDYLLVDSIKNGMDIKEFTKNKEEWIKESGFETSEPKDYTNYNLRKLPFIEASKVERYYSLKKNTTTITDTEFYRTGNEKIYKAPHILIKEGQKNKQFCVSFLDYDCTFRKTVYGVYNDDANLLKMLTVYLNSKLVTYLLFMTSASWGIEREMVNSNEVLSLPLFDFLQSKKTINFLKEKLEVIIKYKTKIFDHSEYQIQKIEDEINNYLYENLNLSEEDKFLINNVVDYSLDFINNGDKSKSILPTDIDDIKEYAKLLCSHLNNLLNNRDTNIWANVYSNDKSSPLCLMSLHFNNRNSNNKVIHNNDINVNSLLKSLNKLIYQKHSESIYFRKVVKYYRKDIVYIAKPNQKRFWTNAIALDDSDLLFLEIATNE